MEWVAVTFNSRSAKLRTLQAFIYYFFVPLKSSFSTSPFFNIIIGPIPPPPLPEDSLFLSFFIPYPVDFFLHETDKHNPPVSDPKTSMDGWGLHSWISMGWELSTVRVQQILSLIEWLFKASGRQSSYNGF